MGIEIQLTPDISLQGIQDEINQGVSAVRSAHVGNARGYNLAVADKRIPMLLIDHNIASQWPNEPGDRNYLPGSIVTREGVSPMTLSSAGGLALRTTTTCPEGRYQRFVDELHVMGLRAAFPDTPIVTNTEYLRADDARPVTEAVVRATRIVAPHLFTRKIEAGEAAPIKAAFQAFDSDIDRYGILQLNDDPRRDRGVLLPNEADIVAGLAIEALRSGRQTQIHLSGPDMQCYIKDSQTMRTLSDIYHELRRTAPFGQDLPETLRVQLVPADHAQFVTTTKRAERLQTVFNLAAQLPERKTERAAFFKTEAASDLGKREAWIAEMDKGDAELAQEISAAMAECPEILDDPKGAPFISQYDVLNEHGLFMPNANETLTMRELQNFAKTLRRIRERTP